MFVRRYPPTLWRLAVSYEMPVSKSAAMALGSSGKSKRHGRQIQTQSPDGSGVGAVTLAFGVSGGGCKLGGGLEEIMNDSGPKADVQSFIVHEPKLPFLPRRLVHPDLPLNELMWHKPAAHPGAGLFFGDEEAAAVSRARWVGVSSPSFDSSDTVSTTPRCSR
jgi:hypothetical protein